jgi:hypothetical protein
MVLWLGEASGVPKKKVVEAATAPKALRPRWAGERVGTRMPVLDHRSITAIC